MKPFSNLNPSLYLRPTSQTDERVLRVPPHLRPRPEKKEANLLSLETTAALKVEPWRKEGEELVGRAKQWPTCRR